MTDQLLARLEAVTLNLEKVAASIGGSGCGGGEAQEESPSVAAWDDYFSSSVSPFCAAARKLKLDKVAELTETGWNNIGELMRAAAVSKKPSTDDLSKFIKPAASSIEASRSLIDNRSDTFHHHSAFVEIISSLGWIMSSPTPQGLLQGQLEAADFYLSKVLFAKKDVPDKADHRDFVRLAKQMLNELKAYVKQWHTTGVEYKGSGSINNPPSKSAARPSAAGAPPPLAAAAAPAIDKPSGDGGGGGFGAVLSDLKKGSDITSGLKKVTSDMKTKNRPSDERSGLVKTKAGGPSAPSPNKWSSKQEKVHPPSISLVRGQHIIEYQIEGQARVPEGANIKQGVNIYRCGQVLIQVPEKVKAVMIDNCTKTRVVIDSVVSAVEVVNCKSITVIITGKVNSVSVDKTSGCQLWLPKECLTGFELITSGISEVNIQVPGDSPDDDPIEIPVPEQFKTVIKGLGKKTTLLTESVKHG